MGRLFGQVARWVVVASLLVAGGCRNKTDVSQPKSPKKTKASRLEKTIDVVYAASAHVRVVDGIAGRVTGRIQLQKAVRAIQFSPDGRFAYLATSDGVRKVDAKTHVVRGHWTQDPARDLQWSPDGWLTVLQHRVSEHNGQRKVSAFSLLALDPDNGEVVHRAEVGERMLFAHRGAPGTFQVSVNEFGVIRVMPAGDDWSAGSVVDVREGFESNEPYRVRPGAVVAKNRIYVPIEGSPARVLRVDLTRGTTALWSLHARLLMRGLAVTPDERTLLVNASDRLIRVTLPNGEIDGDLSLGSGGHIGITISSDGRRAYVAKTVDGTGGAVVAIDVAEWAVLRRIHLDDISPWALRVQPSSRSLSSDR